MRGEEHFKRGKKTNGNQPSDLSNKAFFWVLKLDAFSFALFITDGFASSELKGCSNKNLESFSSLSSYGMNRKPASEKLFSSFSLYTQSECIRKSLLMKKNAMT